MIESALMHWWVAILGSLAMIAFVLLASGIMLGMTKPGDAVKHGGAILGIIIALMFAPCIILNAWLAVPLWQRIALLAIGICIWQWRRPRRQSPKRDRQ